MSARFNLEFPDDYKEIVAELMTKTGLRTQKDVFENALALFSWAVRETARKRVIASLDEDEKTYAQIHMPPLMKVASDALLPPKQERGDQEGGRSAANRGRSRKQARQTAGGPSVESKAVRVG
jgi:hypothetical protein